MKEKSTKEPLVAIIIQARMGSTRLPGKSLLDVCGKPLIWHVISRALKSDEASAVILATTTDKIDDPLHKLALDFGFTCFRGDPDDVLDRYYQAAKSIKAKIIVRITGDSPLVDPHIIDEAVRIIKKENYDYVSNGQQPWMDGFDVEVFTFAALENAWKNAKMASEREHVTPYLRNSGNFKIYYLKNDPWFANLQLSVDRPNDLELIRKIYALLLKDDKDHDFSSLDIKNLLLAHTALLQINKGAKINEGYEKSLKEDKKIK